ncbi:IPT/TIG domain protein [Teladorsagia circumcincta]|uniref:Exocyst complex component 2 n=1 Tax=Teladorsagia circumcincta TaxID=45464 RepID=A0A2G9UKD9_TELCI|nr:IPT/TIG domain protein [Teladorsagia circumcincta]
MTDWLEIATSIFLWMAISYAVLYLSAAFVALMMMRRHPYVILFVIPLLAFHSLKDMSEGDRLPPPGTKSRGPPTVTGLSPTEGTPGTQITIRGENLGTDQNDLLMLFICGTDCMHTAKWKTDKKIIARLGQANRGLGEVKIATKSGGRGICNVKFRVFIAQIGPLEESAVWVDETQTVPGREYGQCVVLQAVRTVAQTSEERDALGLKPTTKKMDPTLLSKLFPDGSGNIRMESFNPQWYLLEHHSETP